MEEPNWYTVRMKLKITSKYVSNAVLSPFIGEFMLTN